MKKSHLITLSGIATALVVGIGSSLAMPQRATASETGISVPALDDPTIIAIFDAANTVDIETGTLAAEKGVSTEVREFGKMLARDHQMVRQLGRDLAAKLHVTPTPVKDDPAVAAHAAAMTRLRSLKGSAFDHAFLQHEVAFHKSVIDAVNSTLLPAIQNAELKALVVKVAPAFEGHMIAARALDEKLSKSATK